MQGACWSKASESWPLHLFSPPQEMMQNLLILSPKMGFGTLLCSVNVFCMKLFGCWFWDYCTDWVAWNFIWYWYMFNHLISQLSLLISLIYRYLSWEFWNFDYTLNFQLQKISRSDIQENFSKRNYFYLLNHCTNYVR